MLIHPNAREFFLKGGKEVGFLLIHGFTGTPSEMMLLGRYLNSKGYPIMAPLLKGHGTNIYEMEKTNREDWLNSAMEGYQTLKSHSEYIIPVGLSMGGILALNIASREKVLGVVSMSAPMIIKSKTAFMAPILKNFIRFSDKKTKPAKKDAQYRISYDKNPMKSVEELMKLIRETRRILKDVKAPALLLQSSDDPTVELKSLEILYNELTGTHREKIILDKGRHVITVEEGREKVFEMIESFGIKVYNNL